MGCPAREVAEFVVAAPAPWKSAKERGTPIQTRPGIRGGPPAENQTYGK
jgi:hypothetical protein